MFVVFANGSDVNKREMDYYKKQLENIAKECQDTILYLKGIESDYEKGSCHAFFIVLMSIEKFLQEKETPIHSIHTDIQSLKGKYPQYVITVSVEEKENG